MYIPSFPLTKLTTRHKNCIIRVNIWDTAKNTILSHRYYIKLLPHYLIRNTNLFHCPLSKMQSYPLGKLPPNVYSIQVHAIILPSFFLTKPDLDKINGFISEKRPMTYRKSTIMNMFGCLFPFELCSVSNNIKVPQKMEFTKSKFTISNEVNHFLTCK